MSERLLEYAEEQFAKPSDAPPPCLEYLWVWFHDLQFDREVNMGAGYIKSSEYEAWARLNRIKISVSELSVLKTLDRAFVSHVNAKDAPVSEESFAQSMKSLGEQIGKPKKGSKK